MNHYILPILTILAILLLSGCATLDTPHGRGAATADAALIVFDDPSDEAKFQETLAEINLWLASGKTLSTEIVNKYSAKLAKRFGKNPILIRAAARRILAYADTEEFDERGREFLTGVRDELMLFVGGAE